MSHKLGRTTAESNKAKFAQEPGVSCQHDAAELWTTFSGKLRQFLAARVDNQADIDDMLQDVFLTVQREDLSRVRNVNAWLFRITRNLLIDHERRVRTRRNYRGSGETSVATESAEPEFKSRLSRCLTPLIARLEPLDRQLITEIDINGNRQVDVARDLGLPYSTLKSRTQRSRMKLRELFLSCCKFEFDNSGNAIDYEGRKEDCPFCS